MAALIARAAEAGTVTMTIDPTPLSVLIGQTFDLTVNVQAGAQPIDTVGAYVNFDPTLLQVTGTTPGATLPTAVQNAFDNTAGQVNYTATILAGTVSGSFAVVTIHWQAMATGTTNITFAHTLPRLTGAFLVGVDETGTLTGATVNIGNTTPTNTPSTPVPTATRTRTGTATPTRTLGSPAPTRPFTNTPSPTSTPTLENFCQPAAGFCQPVTATPSPQATHTSVPQPAGAIGVAQEEAPGPGQCICTVLYGQVFDVPGEVAANRRVTLETTFEQDVDGCLIHISHRTYTTDGLGFIPPDFTAIGGSTIHVSLEGDVPIQLVVPREPRVSLAVLLGGVQARAPSDVITGIAVDNTGADLELTALLSGTSVILEPGHVHHFTLTANADAGGRTIAHVGTGTTAGDVMPFGQPVTGDFTGFLPAPTLANPVRHGISAFIGGSPLTTGQCLTAEVLLDGVANNNAVVVTPDTPTTGMVWGGNLTQPNIATVFTCATTPVIPTSTQYYVRAF